jgi:CPA1 family monovalent cation:H+ antiporter
VGSVYAVLFLVVVATVVAVSARWLSVPAPSLLVVAGLIIGLIPSVPAVRVTPEIVALVVLPPLLYAAGQELTWRDLHDVWRPVTVLAVGLVLASAAAVGAVTIALTPLPTSMAFVLGAVLASTDPVAVTALGRRLPLPERIRALIQAESLFNDATSLVLFRVAVSIAVIGGAVSWGRAAGQLLLLAGGGALVGAVTAAGVMLIRSRTEDPVLETVISLVTPYAAYVVAEELHVSGVTAVVVASVILSGVAARVTNAQIRLQVHAVYGTVVFLLESVVFGLIGLQLPTLIREAGASLTEWPLQALAITATLLAVRMLWVFPLSAAMHARRSGEHRSRVAAVVSWAGARGVLPLTAALSIPFATAAGTPLPGRDLVLLLATAVIVITLTAQGFTLAPLVRRSGIALGPGHAQVEYETARVRMAEAALAHLDLLGDLEAVPVALADRLRRGLQARIRRLDRPNGESAEPTYRKLRRDLIAAEAAELNRMYADGTISESTRRRLQRVLDLEDASLGDE